MNRIKFTQLLKNMGWRYTSFRLKYELQRRTGILKKKFPVNPASINFMPLDKWKGNCQPFLFQSRHTLKIEKNKDENLKEAAEKILSGKIQFFNNQYVDLGTEYDWITNPDTGYKYDINKHWTEVEDLVESAGDIKFVWEKSRFSYLHTIMRYDYHFDEDHSDFVFSEIEHWMNSNPINKGPNYKCSQEISLRSLNWITALYFYKDSNALTDAFFQKMINYLYWQLHHVYHNINFSRIAVRNNHAITETLALYIIPLIFPQFRNAKKWSSDGKKWFEEEIEYQIYKDGTFLQFSMNYHRVVIQLLTFGIRIAQLYKDRFKDVVYERAYKSVNYLYQCQEDSNGYLPNYGANDGALFFKFSNNNYRDYRPQLEALHTLLTGCNLYKENYEDKYWFGEDEDLKYQPISKQPGIICFEEGGYYLIREKETLTFIKCGKYKDRPSHADNLHIDVWHKGENILIDGGTYKYNTDSKSLKYFMGTSSHNTVMLDNNDQMLKGSRFIWYNWTQSLSASLKETVDYYEFTGKISCFTYISPDIIHERKIRKYKNSPKWEVEDIIHNKPEESIVKQLWHTFPESNVELSSIEGVQKQQSEYSSYYGQKQTIDQFVVGSDKTKISTIISIKE